MNKEQLAAKLTGREYPFEMTKAEIAEAKAAGLVVVYGASDDLMEFEGAINDECYPPNDGGDVFVTAEGPLEGHEDCECKWCGFAEAKKKAKKIEALWCKEGDYSWTYKTAIPHDNFEIVEDGKPYCRGIVFDIASLK